MQEFWTLLVTLLDSLDPQASLLSIFKEQTYINPDFMDVYATTFNTVEGLELLKGLYSEAWESLKITETRLLNIRTEISFLKKSPEFLIREDSSSFFIIKDQEEVELSAELFSIQEEYFSDILLEKQQFCEAIDILGEQVWFLQQQ